jgi:hypothetical protein
VTYFLCDLDLLMFDLDLGTYLPRYTKDICVKVKVTTKDISPKV